MELHTIAILLGALQFAFSWDFDIMHGCRTEKLDLVFLVDGSTQEFHRNYPLVRQWIQNITANFDVSSSTTRVAVVQNALPPYMEFSFQNFVTAEEVFQAVNNIQYGAGSGTTAQALRYTRNHVLKRARPDATIVVLVLSDDEIESPEEGLSEVKMLHDIGVTTLAIGAGAALTREVQLSNLKALASHSVHDHTFIVESLPFIGTLERSIIWEICKHTVEECPTAFHDLAFVIDSSSTIGRQNFQKEKTWMKKIVEAFDLGMQKTRIAVIQYSDFVREEIRFDDGYSKSQIIDKIDQMTLISGDTHTGNALEYCMRKTFSGDHGSRSDVPDVVIVMTDGKAQDRNHVVNAARRLHEAGIEVYALGVGDSYSMEEIRVIASDPDYYHILHASSFRQREFQLTGLIKRICVKSETRCPNTVADIVFLVDNKVVKNEENLENMKTWIKGIVDYVEIGEHHSRVSLVRFGAFPEMIFDLQDYTSTSSLISRITRFQRSKYIDERDHSAVGVAIDYVRSTIFGHAKRNVPRFLVIVTNGESSDDFGPAVARANNAGIKLFSFGVGNVNIKNLATSPNFTFHEPSLLDARRRIGDVMSVMCQISEPACAVQEIEVQFLVDGSDNIRLEDFKNVKRWIRNVVRSFDIGNYTTRVGVMMYADRVQKVFGMDTYSSKQDIDDAVNQMMPMFGRPKMGEALYHSLSQGFTQSVAGIRPEAAKVLVVLSDGNSTDSADGISLKMQQAGIKVLAVGVGPFTDRHILEKITTEPMLTHVTQSSSYEAIDMTMQKIIDEICQETVTECPEAEMDLIFLVDGSTTAARFSQMKKWLISFVSQFSIVGYNSNIGMLQFSHSTRVEINLTKASDKESLMRKIHEMGQLRGEAYIGRTLEYVRQQFFSGQSKRRNIPKVIITLTSGRSRDSWITPAWRLKNDGDIMYVVAFEDVQKTDLHGLASSTESTFYARSVDAIPIIQTSLISRLCQRRQIDCAERATDIVMLVDGSYSVGKKSWELVKSFVQNITNRFEIGPHAVQLSVVQFATEPRIEFLLGQYDTWYSLMRAIRRIRWMTGDTHTAKALRYARKHVLTPEAGSRRNATKLLFVITDGSPQDINEVNSAAMAVKDYGWQIFAIGLEEASVNELNMMASNPVSDHVFYADNFDSTRLLEGRLFRMICQELVKQTYVEPAIRRRGERHDPELDLSVSSQKYPVAPITKLKLSSRQEQGNGEPEIDVGSLLKSRPVSRAGTKDTNDNVFSVVKGSVPGLYSSSSCGLLRTTEGDYVYGWDFLLEMGIVRLRTTAKHKGDNLRDSFESERTQSHFVTTRSTGKIKAFRISAAESVMNPLSQDFAKIFHSTWSFSVTLRTHFTLNRTTWCLINLTDASGNPVFSVNINDMEKTISIEILSGDARKSVFLTGDRISSIFDKKFHKLEVIAGENQATVKLDCEVIARSLISTPQTVSKDLLGSLITSPSNGLAVDIQDMLFKCQAEEESCYELDGNYDEPGAATSNMGECDCPPGRQGPPGRSLRGVAGKTGPRGPPGKRTIVKKSVIRATVRKIASAIVKGEIKRMFKRLLSIVPPEGTVNQKVIRMALSAYS